MDGNDFGRKSLFGVYDDVKIDILKGLGTFATNTKAFLESVKIIFKQKGFVASAGLKAKIYVAPKPISFGML